MHSPYLGYILSNSMRKINMKVLIEVAKLVIMTAILVGIVAGMVILFLQQKERGDFMTDAQKKALKTLEAVIPKCDDKQADIILRWGEAIAYFLDNQKQKEQTM